MSSMYTNVFFSFFVPIPGIDPRGLPCLKRVEPNSLPFPPPRTQYCSHPSVATDCTDAMRRQLLGDGGAASAAEGRRAASSTVASCPPSLASLPQAEVGGRGWGERVRIHKETVSLGRGARLLRSDVVGVGGGGGGSPPSRPVPASPSGPDAAPSDIRVPARRHPVLVLELPRPLGGSVQLHPRDGHAGLACMIDGSLALFRMPPEAYHEALPSMMASDGAGDDDDDDDSRRMRGWVAELLEEEERSMAGKLAYVVPPQGNGPLPPGDPPRPQYFITCAAFGKNGDVLWAVTK